jgi:hypothetical protein
MLLSNLELNIELLVRLPIHVGLEAAGFKRLWMVRAGATDHTKRQPVLKKSLTWSALQVLK